MRLCHETSLAGHLSITATKIFRRFTCPNITMDVKNYIGSCHQCQIHAPRLPKLPIEEMEAISKPFERVAIDIVDPLPMTRNKDQYIHRVQPPLQSNVRALGSRTHRYHRRHL
ncbi:reverse transcriptase [Plakobranchus ocellatus]|uniref:Reverse transcriptase n=1 Tax=Plakobranchus ocellatus TaxID=259542 RepID=A0AAV4CVV5_9GAST|nr:reverse transcriptase [Plakobranchus ocellatus]